MDISLMQQSALRNLQTLQASTSGSLLVAGSSESCVRCNSSFSFGRLNSPNRVSVWKRQISLKDRREKGLAPCPASGGSRRDEGKIVARTQRRRSRHVKGVTPTKPELFDELQAEEEADEELDNFQANLDNTEAETSSDSEDTSDSEASSSSEGGVELLEKPTLKPEGTKPASRKFNDNGNCSDKEVNAELNNRDSNLGTEETLQSSDNIYTNKYSPQGKPSLAGPAVEDIVKDTSTGAQDTATEIEMNYTQAGNTVRENTEDGVQQASEITGEVLDVAEDTRQTVSSTAGKAAEEVGTNLSEAGDVLQENVQDGAEQFGTAVGEVAEIAQDTTQEVTRTAGETAQEAGKSLEDAGDAVRESLFEVGSQGQKLVQEGAETLGEQFQEGQKETEADLSAIGDSTQEAGERTWKALRKVTDEAASSFQTVQESMAAVIEDSAKAAGTIGSETLRLGDVVPTAAAEAIGYTSKDRNDQTQDNNMGRSKSNGSAARQAVKEKSTTGSSNSKEASKQTPQRDEIQSRQQKSSQSSETKEEEKNPYLGFKVTVAGASGRTGRLVVDELVRKGVPVTALVRDKNKSEARALARLPNVEIVQADLYKYETVKKALADSNVVISAIGARSFPFDPIGTYQAEFEGVRNLVAAARNKGDVKKFVFITSLGVTFLQVIPLLFWKKQSELYLQRSGLDYTIVRPGGLTNANGSEREVLSFKPADTQFGGAISRKKVAEVCVAALITPESSEKVIEVVSGGGVEKNFAELFASV